MDEFTLGAFNTELEIARDQYKSEAGETPGAEFLTRAAEADDSYKKKSLDEAQKAQRLAEAIGWARRDSTIEEAEIETLFGVVGTVSEASYECGYVLSSMLLGAAVGRSGIATRIRAAGISVNAAVSFERLPPARRALEDYLESLRLLIRFFNPDQNVVRTMTGQVVATWSRMKGELGVSDELFDISHADDGARFLLDLVIWNTDFGRGNGGYIPQTDALARLVIRLEHYVEMQGGDAMAMAAAWREALEKGYPIPDERVENGLARCAGTCAEALLQIGRPEAASHLYESILNITDYARSPLSSRAKIGQALALYQCGRHEEAVAAFRTVDAAQLEQLAGMILTVRADWARYIAASSILLGAKEATPSATAEAPRTIVEDIARMLIGSSDGRTGYLRSLFVGELARDVESILALDGQR